MAVEILKKLISYQSVTPNECGIYDYIMSLLPDFKALRADKGEVKNLFLYKIPEGYDESDFGRLEHFCFAGHIDVVPVGADWHYPPFHATLENGYIYGRGTQDMKGGIACFLKALQECRVSNAILSVLLTSDEEGDAVNGTRHILEILKQKNMLPKHAIVSEPTCHKIVGDTIKIGRRGSINGEIIIEGKQGHVAYPSKCINPIELLGERLGKIAGKNLDNGDSNFEPSKLVITDIHAGIGVSNVVPKDLIIKFNVRNGIQTSTESISEYLDSILHNLPYTLTLKESAKSFLTEDIKLREMLKSSIHDVEVDFSTGGGTSDARYFAQYHVNVVELGVCNDRIHATDERVSLEDIERLSTIFKEFLHKIP